MVELKSIEQLLYFMKTHIQLSRYDEKFIDNISTLSTVTTNQVVLFHRLVYKYRRQFSSHELFVEGLLELPWNVNIIESSPQYTHGHVSIIENTIYFKCPFNRNFIDEFRKQTLNPFVWNKQKRYYEAPYNIHSLKILINTSKRFFKEVHLCDTTTKLVDEVKEYADVKYWHPTLVQRNNHLFIMATNQALDDALGNTTLSTDYNTLINISKHGVTIDSSFYENDKKLKFICQYDPIVEQSEIDDLIGWLKEINCDMVFLSGINSINWTKKKFIEKLEYNKINYCDLYTVVPPKTLSYKCSVYVKFKKFSDGPNEQIRVSKVVSIVNSNPVEVK